MVTRVEIPGGMLAWARERSRVPADELARKFPRLGEWELGLAAPTLKQLEGYAAATYTPIGYFFLPEPPIVPVPLPDFRTIGDQAVRWPSPNLLDSIYDCQRRQEWYRDNALATGEAEVPIVGSMTAEDDAQAAAVNLRGALGFEVGQRGPSWSEAFRRLTENAEDLGVLVMVNGVVGSNTHRKLDPEEFRGFALVDPYAPVVFVNGSDSKSAQIFTLAHEIAHIVLGESGLDDAEIGTRRPVALERWCNSLAAELLVPEARLAEDWREGNLTPSELERLATLFRVSTLVVLRRLFDVGRFNWETFSAAYRAERTRIRSIMDEAESGSGGNFYNTQPVRTSKRFTRSLISSTLEGQTLYRDAFQMLGFRRQSTFNELAHRLGVA